MRAKLNKSSHTKTKRKAGGRRQRALRKLNETLVRHSNSRAPNKKRRCSYNNSNNNSNIVAITFLVLPHLLSIYFCPFHPRVVATDAAACCCCCCLPTDQQHRALPEFFLISEKRERVFCRANGSPWRLRLGRQSPLMPSAIGGKPFQALS